MLYKKNTGMLHDMTLVYTLNRALSPGQKLPVVFALLPASPPQACKQEKFLARKVWLILIKGTRDIVSYKLYVYSPSFTYPFFIS